MLKIKTIKPMFTALVVTSDKFKEDMYNDHGVIEKGCTEGSLKSYQKVVAVGDAVRGIKEGDKVVVNWDNYAIRQYDPNSVKNDFGMNKIIDYIFTEVYIFDDQDNRQKCILIDQRDVLYVYEGEEVQGVKNPILVPEKKGIVIS